MIRTKRGYWIAAVLALSAVCLTGCGKDEVAALGGNAGSCTVVGGGFTTCFDYTGAAYTAESAQTGCSTTQVGETTGGTYSTSACTTTGRVGSCKLFAGLPAEQSIRYYGGYLDAAAQLQCTNASGTYTSG